MMRESDNTMMAKTLYISDLDGTLLRGDQRTSAFTNETIHTLTERGMIFSYATARSFSTAQKVTAGLTARIPVIVYNGAFIVDNESGELLHTNFFSGEDGAALVRELVSHGVSPIVYAFAGGRERFAYNAQKINVATQDFVKSRAGDRRDTPLASDDALTDGEIFYITCIDEAEKLRPFFERYRNRFHCVFQKDIYSGEQWLEIMPASTTKANAARELAKRKGCSRIVAFGDGKNDIDLFEIADEAYAVENADAELKARATAVIGSNDTDGVARWLRERFGEGE